MEIAMWGGWTLLLVWYLNALRGDIRGEPVVEELMAGVENASLTKPSSET